MNREERCRLIDQLLDGTISDADRLRLEAELIVDPEARREYYRRVQLDVLLEREAAESAADSASKPLETPRVPRVSPPTSWIKMVVGSLVAIAASLLVWFVIPPAARQSDDRRLKLAWQSPEPLNNRAELSASGFAVLNGQENAVWLGTSFDEGDILPSGELHLAAGLAHLELFSGVQVVLAGAARFRIDSPMQITMVQGTARARVPKPAQGFRIKTVSGDIVDLGTEFSVSVDQEGADVHVIDGEIELHPQGSELMHLHAGASRRLSVAGDVIVTKSQFQDTVGPNEFQDRIRQQRSQKYAEWVDWKKVIQSHPQLVAHYRFRSDRLLSRRIVNSANANVHAASDGTIVAAQRVEDRWKRSGGAVDFSPIGSRVRVDVPGEHRGLTLLCWVKINSLDRWYNSLFLTDGHEDREPHWQLMDDGRIFFSVKVPSGNGETIREQPVFYSPSIWDASLSGRWMMLAVTYDVDRQKVTHYLNGKAISSETIADRYLVESIRVGQASICNWSEPMYRTDPKFVLRNLNGTMDEFAMFSTALSANEILQWYELGNPND